jgi:hypothetical protein
MLDGVRDAVVLAGVLLAFARLHDGAWEPGMQVAGICRELLAGTTQGRQALFGSCWSAPLPVLVYLPFAWLLPEPLAGWAAFFARGSLRSGRCASGQGTGQSGWRIVLAQAAIAGMMDRGAPAAGAADSPRRLRRDYVLLAAPPLADWAAFRRCAMWWRPVRRAPSHAVRLSLFRARRRRRGAGAG